LAGWFQNASALTVAATVWTLTALVLLACWKVRTIRVCVLNIDLRWLVVLHLTRLFAGAYFLVLCQRRVLPCAFATPAGWGDIVIGVLAVALVGSMHIQFAKTVLLSWNTLGLIDIVFVVSSVLRFGLKDWQPMERAAGTSAQSSPDISGATYYRVTRIDLRPADPNANWFAVTAWQRSQLVVGGTAARR
jgi:hypothetical protein